jgi:multiple sugar transport system substrate-binding protein
MFRSKLGPILAATTALALLGVTASSAQDKITVRFANWATAEGTTAPAMEEVIAKFEAANPNIDIVSESISFSEIAQQMVLRIRSGNPPDVAQLAGNDTLLIASTGRLEPLEGRIDAGLKAKLKPEALNGFTVNDQLIALPWIQAPAGFWYNKAIMEKAGLNPKSPPKTIAELMTAM